MTACPPHLTVAEPSTEDDDDEDAIAPRAGTAADGATIKEGSFVIGKDGRLCQIVDGTAVPIEIRRGKSGEGITLRAAKIIRAFCRSAMPCATCCAPRPPTGPGRRRRSGCASPIRSFIRYFGPINHTVVPPCHDPETGEERETHRRPNLAHFADDPDCWLVASIEDYDLETGLARKGPIFDERVIVAARRRRSSPPRPTRSPSP